MVLSTKEDRMFYETVEELFEFRERKTVIPILERMKKAKRHR
jgi:hypothetical protein